MKKYCIQYEKKFNPDLLCEEFIVGETFIDGKIYTDFIPDFDLKIDKQHCAFSLFSRIQKFYDLTLVFKALSKKKF